MTYFDTLYDLICSVFKTLLLKKTKLFYREGNYGFYCCNQEYTEKETSIAAS